MDILIEHLNKPSQLAAQRQRKLEELQEKWVSAAPSAAEAGEGGAATASAGPGKRKRAAGGGGGRGKKGKGGESEEDATDPADTLRVIILCTTPPPSSVL